MKRHISGPLHEGNTTLVLEETVTETSTFSEIFTIDSDSVLLSLWVDSTAGDLDVTAYTLVSGLEQPPVRKAPIITFPTISAPTTNLLLQKAATTLSIVQVVVTTTGAASFRIDAKGTTSAEGSVRIVGSSDFETASVSVTSSPSVIIAPSLASQNGILLKNFSNNRNIFVGKSLATASNAGGGYPLSSGETLPMNVAAGTSIYASTDSAPADLRIVRTGG